MDKITQYMDVTVLLTNLYNKCALDYIMQRVGVYTGSISGASDLLINFLFRFFSSDDASIYTAMSTAVTNGDRAGMGL